MAARNQRDRIGAMVEEVEALANRLGKELRKRARAAGVLKDVEALGNRLRNRAGAAAARVEKYVHEIRQGLEGGGRASRSTPRRSKGSAKA